MSQPASEHTLLYLWKFVGGAPQELSFEDSMKIEASYRANPAKPVKLGSLVINLKSKTAYDTTSNNCSRPGAYCGTKSGASFRGSSTAACQHCIITTPQLAFKCRISSVSLGRTSSTSRT